jgi:hypothetical protein
MKTKSTKVYTLAQVKTLLRKGTTTIYTYVNAGLIRVIPEKMTAKSGRPVMVVSEAEYERLKRNGVDSSGIKAKAAKPAKRRVSGKTAAAKKTAKKRPASATAAHKTAGKKRAKRKGVR